MTVVEVRGNRLTVRDKQGQLIKDLHTEDALVVPESTRDLEHALDDGDAFFDDEYNLPA